MNALFLLWPVCGWFFGAITIYQAYQEGTEGVDLAIGIVLCLFCGAVVGPIGVLWIILCPPNEILKEWAKERRRARNRVNRL
jgi:hypothetical protein